MEVDCRRGEGRGSEEDRKVRGRREGLSKEATIWREGIGGNGRKCNCLEV